MAIKVLVTPPEDETTNDIKVLVTPPEEKPDKIIKLVARKTIDGNVMIMDHDMIDIVINPSAGKIITFTKTNKNDLAYETQDRLFDFLHRRGFIDPSSVRGGNVYGSIEGTFPTESDYTDPFNAGLSLISEFIESERSFLDVNQFVDDVERERLLDPDAADSTELGEVPHEDKKGTKGALDYYPGYYYGHMYQE